jgi:hypothetical protein
MDKVKIEIDMLANKLNIMNMSVEKQMDDQKSKFDEKRRQKMMNGSGGTL